jgi:hypothetical protein
MTITDYAIDIVLIGLVAFQIHGMRLTRRALILPLVLVGIVATNYLKTIPTAGNDLFLIVGLTAIGATLGSLAGLFTSVRQDSSGTPVAKAGAVAAILWVLGVGSRFAFQLYVSHGGFPAVAHFSATHDITSGAAWTAALVLMALTEVLCRHAIIVFRAHRRFALTLESATQSVPRGAMMSANGRSF